MIGAFSEEAPKDGAEQEINGVVRDVVAEAEELGEDDIEDSKKQERAEKCPKVAEDGALVAEFEIGFGEALLRERGFVCSRTGGFS